MSLRTLLILVGIAIVIAVYLFSARKRQRDSRITYDRRFSRLDIPDVILEHDDDPEFDDNVDTVISGSARVVKPEPPPGLRATPTGPHIARLPDDVVLPPEHMILDDLPVVRNDSVQATEPSNARRRLDQLELFGGADAVPEPAAPASARRSVPRGAAKAAPAVATPADDGLITLYVRAREGHQFAGTTLVRALNSVGMQHGEMAIFHHFGAGELKCATAVFSAANMFEPGTFDLGRIEAFRTSGLALFLQLPGPLDGPVAFELLLNTAQRLTELVGGELFVNPQTRLDSKNIARLRGRAALFAHARS